MHLNLNIQARKVGEQPAQFFLPAAEVWEFTVTCPHQSVTVNGLIAKCTKPEHTSPDQCEPGRRKALTDASKSVGDHYLAATECPCATPYWMAKGAPHQVKAEAISAN